MRVPCVYSATEIVNWHVAEEYEPGKWRPARCLPFSGWGHFRTRYRIAWRVFAGQLDALNWNYPGTPYSGLGGWRYKDCNDPEFFSAIRVHEVKTEGGTR